MKIIQPLTCEGCGKCCMYMGSPPFMADEWDALPSAMREEIDASEESPEHDRDGPCLWLDLETKQCRNYAHRPDVCRDFELGGDDCIAVRESEA